MPIDPSQHRASLGRFEHQHSTFIPNSIWQNRNNNLAQTISNKLPQTASAQSALLSFLLLSQITTVQSSTAGTPAFAAPHTTSDSAISTQASAVCKALPMVSQRQTYSPACPSSVACPVLVTACQTKTPLSFPERPSAALTTTISPVDNAGFLKLPMAAATTEQIPANSLIWNTRHKFYAVNDETVKGSIIKELTSILVQLDLLSQSKANELEFDWKQKVAGQTLYVIPTVTRKPRGIEKRRSFKSMNEDIMNHIKKNCAGEMEITDLNGRNKAEVKLFVIQEWKKFLKQPDSTLRKILHAPEVSKMMGKTFDFVGLVIFNTVEMISTAITDLLAAYYRRQHYQLTNDSICLLRQNRFALATIATSLELGGTLNRPKTVKKFFSKPPELSRTLPLDSEAIFFTRNKQLDTQTELIMTAQSHSERVNQFDPMVINSQTQSRYVGHNPQKKGLPKDSVPIEFDDAMGVWRESLPPHLPLLNVELQSGRTFVMIHGERYPLRLAGYMKYQIVVKRPSGEVDFLPVYRDRISKSWHLKTKDRQPIFPPDDEALIQRIKIEVDDSRKFELVANDNPAFYGDANIVKVSDASTGVALADALEMNGEVIPIHKISVERRGSRYDVLDPYNPYNDAHSPVWDGDRWSLEPATSPYVSLKLKKQISPDMYVSDVNLYSLSAPDKHGLRWDINDNAYLKVRHEFVRVLPESQSTLRDHNGNPLSVVFADGQFQPAPITALQVLPVPPLHETISAPGSVALVPALNEDIPDFNRFHKTMRYLLENHWVPDMGKTELIDNLHSMFPRENITVQQVPSSNLTTIRSMVSVSDLRFFLDSSLEGNDSKLLNGPELEQALSKYDSRLNGGRIHSAIGLTRDETTPATTRSQSEMALLMRKRVKDGCNEIRNILDQQTTLEQQRTLLLANHDFLGEGSVTLNSYAPPKVLYEALIEFFIPLSRAYPNVIIAPGSIYISTDIPETLRRKKLTYTADNGTPKVAQAVHFSAIVAPVFYNGTLVTTARRGEYLAYQTHPDNNESISEAAIWMDNLDTPIPSGARLIVHNDNQDHLIDPIDADAGHQGTIFSGKTLLPGERVIAESVLRPHMAKNSTAKIFQSDFMVQNEKFLLIIGNEFKVTRNFLPSLRLQLLPINSSEDGGVRYDWILHQSSGEALDERLRSIADNYLLIDRSDQSNHLSNIAPRIHTVETFSQSDLTIHYYHLGEDE